VQQRDSRVISARSSRRFAGHPVRSSRCRNTWPPVRGAAAERLRAGEGSGEGGGRGDLAEGEPHEFSLRAPDREAGGKVRKHRRESPPKFRASSLPPTHPPALPPSIPAQLRRAPASLAARARRGLLGQGARGGEMNFPGAVERACRCM